LSELFVTFILGAHCHVNSLYFSQTVHFFSHIRDEVQSLIEFVGVVLDSGTKFCVHSFVLIFVTVPTLQICVYHIDSICKFFLDCFKLLKYASLSLVKDLKHRLVAVNFYFGLSQLLLQLCDSLFEN
jgi:hypothetical protein